MQALIHITDIEAAINYWRVQPDGIEGVVLGRALRALAHVYGVMIFEHRVEVEAEVLGKEAMEAWMQWYDTMPDAPCIAICSTSQGDEVCKGCGRTFEEVQHWTAMAPVHKREVWRRITQEGTALRFTRYQERGKGSVGG